MKQIRIGRIVPILILLVSVLSCGRFGSSNVAKPTQVVDIPAMIGKSRQEIREMVGIPPVEMSPSLPYLDQWYLAEGVLYVNYDNGKLDGISYNLKYSPGILSFRGGVGSP